MAGTITNKPKILRGAFVEYGLSIPPLMVVFQFNPVQLSRNRSLSFNAPGGKVDGKGASGSGLRKEHEKYASPEAIRDHQLVGIEEESISFDIRLDATNDLARSDTLARDFGVGPRLASLELMVHPKFETLELIGKALSSEDGFSPTKGPKPPIILFVWGRKRILPVNIKSMNITETEFDTTLNPTRATVAVSLTVIEGITAFYLYSKAVKDAMSFLNLANLPDVTDVVVPG